jgi:hypothetical protein
MIGRPTSGLQPHGVRPRSLGSGERLSPTQVQPEWTAEQKAAWERREEARKHWAGGRTFLEAVGTPAQQEADRAAQRDAEEARLRERWPDPRQALRDAHARLRDARGELQHRREVLARAADHLAATRVAHQETAAIQAGVDAQAVERLKAQIDTGDVRNSDIGEPVTGRSARTARDVELAEAAHSELAAAVTEAEKAEERALRGVQEAAVGCVLLRGIGVADEIAEAEQALADRRRALWGIDRLWIDGGPVKLPGKIVAALAGRIMAGGPWEATYKALLADAEVPLP